VLEYCLELKARGEDLNGELEVKKTEGVKSAEAAIKRRERVNRLKVIIVVTVIILLILPTICCIIMGFKINQLQKQVNNLMLLSYGSEVQINDKPSYQGNVAYAAEKDSSSITSEQDENNTASDMINNSSQNKDELKETKSNLTEDTIEKTDNGSSISKEGIYSGKKVYLTFDDGPSKYTADILDILADYGVKATFFVIGKEDDYSKKMYQRIIDEGHTLGMHSYTHIYKNIYNSIEDFDKDFTKLWELLYDITEYKPTLFRFPGGSANDVSKIDKAEMIRYLNEKSIIYTDWNVVSGDASGQLLTKEQLAENVLSGIVQKKTSVVLMHDSITKKATVDSLSIILEALTTQGAKVLPLDDSVPPIQQIEASSIK